MKGLLGFFIALAPSFSSSPSPSSSLLLSKKGFFKPLFTFPFHRDCEFIDIIEFSLSIAEGGLSLDLDGLDIDKGLSFIF